MDDYDSNRRIISPVRLDYETMDLAFLVPAGLCMLEIWFLLSGFQFGVQFSCPSVLTLPCPTSVMQLAFGIALG